MSIFLSSVSLIIFFATWRIYFEISYDALFVNIIKSFCLCGIFLFSTWRSSINELEIKKSYLPFLYIPWKKKTDKVRKNILSVLKLILKYIYYNENIIFMIYYLNFLTFKFIDNSDVNIRRIELEIKIIDTSFADER